MFLITIIENICTIRESQMCIMFDLERVYTIYLKAIPFWSLWTLFHRNVASTELINKLWNRQRVWEIFESETHYICKIQINRKKSEMITKHEYCSCLTICLNQWNLSQVKAETCLFFQWIYEAVSRNLSWKSFSYSVRCKLVALSDKFCMLTCCKEEEK